MSFVTRPLAVLSTTVILLAATGTNSLAQKRTPLTRDLLRSPGHSLHEQAEDLTFSLLSDFVLVVLGSTFAGLVLSVIARRGTTLWLPGIVVSLLVASQGWFALRAWSRWNHRTHLRLGLDAELATGQVNRPGFPGDSIT